MEALDTPATERLRDLYFHKLKHPQDSALDRQLVALVLDHAKRVIAHPSRPVVRRTEIFSRAPWEDLDLDASLEENPQLDDAEQLRVELAEEKPLSCVAILDSSASMAGEKHLLSSISVAVLLLEVAAKETSIVAFNSRANVVKRAAVEEACEETLLRFLKVQPRGFTNIGAGLEEGLKQLRSLGRRKRKIGLIATDGRSTEGDNPLKFASQYDSLIVLHLHGPGSHIDASRELAQHGHGICLEVERFDELPRRLYDALRKIARM